MSYTLKIMDSAKADMRSIYSYIAESLQNPEAAKRRIALIDKAILSLKKNPTSHALARDEYLASKGFRPLVVKNHIIFFIVREKQNLVFVMRVLYGRRDWMNMLRLEADPMPADDPNIKSE
jgi:plasmid stabilization system protein ParE